MDSIDDGVVINLITSLTTALLENLRAMLPEHNKKHRLVKKVEESIKKLAKLNARPIDPDIIQAGVLMWNSCMESLETFLIEYQPDNSEAQRQLFIQDDAGRLYTYVDIYAPKPPKKAKLDMWVEDMLQVPAQPASLFINREKALSFAESRGLFPVQRPATKPFS